MYKGLVYNWSAPYYGNDKGHIERKLYRIPTADHKTRTVGDKSAGDNVPSLNHMHRCSRKIFCSPNRESFERIYLFTILLEGAKLYLCIYNRPLAPFKYEYVVAMQRLRVRTINVPNSNTKNVVRRFLVMHRLCYC